MQAYYLLQDERFNNIALLLKYGPPLIGENTIEPHTDHNLFRSAPFSSHISIRYSNNTFDSKALLIFLGGIVYVTT